MRYFARMIFNNQTLISVQQIIRILTSSEIWLEHYESLKLRYQSLKERFVGDSHFNSRETKTIAENKIPLSS